MKTYLATRIDHKGAEYSIQIRSPDESGAEYVCKMNGWRYDGELVAEFPVELEEDDDMSCADAGLQGHIVSSVELARDMLKRVHSSTPRETAEEAGPRYFVSAFIGSLSTQYPELALELAKVAMPHLVPVVQDFKGAKK